MPLGLLDYHDCQIILKGKFWLTVDLILSHFINCHSLTYGLVHKGNISRYKVSDCVGVL